MKYYDQLQYITNNGLYCDICNTHVYMNKHETLEYKNNTVRCNCIIPTKIDSLKYDKSLVITRNVIYNNFLYSYTSVMYESDMFWACIYKLDVNNQVNLDIYCQVDLDGEKYNILDDLYQLSILTNKLMKIKILE